MTHKGIKSGTQANRVKQDTHRHEKSEKERKKERQQRRAKVQRKAKEIQIQLTL